MSKWKRWRVDLSCRDRWGGVASPHSRLETLFNDKGKLPLASLEGLKECAVFLKILWGGGSGKRLGCPEVTIGCLGQELDELGASSHPHLAALVDGDGDGIQRLVS